MSRNKPAPRVGHVLLVFCFFWQTTTHSASDNCGLPVDHQLCLECGTSLLSDFRVILGEILADADVT